ncbi:MAG: PP0621 family protein [Burkholderiaceae bacterium]
MKYLLVLAVVMVAVWVWRNNRITDERPPPSRSRRDRKTPSAPVAMVACRHCGTHLPESEAFVGRHGSYCSEEHRRLQGD